MFLLDGQNNSVVVNGGEKVRDVSDRSPSIDPIRSDPIHTGINPEESVEFSLFDE